MEQIFEVLSNLEARFIKGLSPTSIDRTPTAIFQFVAKHTNRFLVQIHTNYHLHFEVFYKHKGKFYPHPYTLKMQTNRSMNNSSINDQYQQVTYDISLYLELKRLQDFNNDDLKRYYEVIDKTIDSEEEIHDFHDIYLILNYKINEQPARYQCNYGQPIHLPKFISNLWTHKNTLTRFRYDAEYRDGTFPCEMTLRYGHIANLQSYKIVLCLISNTIPPQMDYHAIRWICKIKSRRIRQNGTTAGNGDKEKSYCLSHSSGIVIAQVYGPHLKFTPQMLYSDNNLNHVQSYFEPEGFRTALEHSDSKENSSLAIVVIKETDYSIRMKNRRKDQDILQYLPFKELDDVNNNLEAQNGHIHKRLKVHKEQCNKQLILNDENGTYSQAHVRVYVAAYDENDVLLTECLYPPIRNNKTFEQLHIMRIVQPKPELYAKEPAYVYCAYDYKSLTEYDTCPYEFELVFTLSTDILNENQLTQLFLNPHICTNASPVPNCPCLLEFQVPDVPKYDKQRVFIRLRHRQSKDYNPSDIALCDRECWIYHADPRSVFDTMLENSFNEFNDPSKSNTTTQYQNSGLEIGPFSPTNLSFDPDDTLNYT